MRKRPYRRRGFGHSILRVFVGLRGTVKDARKKKTFDRAPEAVMPEQPREVVVEKPKDYKTPEHGFDWRSMPPLPVDIAVFGRLGIMDCATGGEERPTPADLISQVSR